MLKNIKLCHEFWSQLITPV